MDSPQSVVSGLKKSPAVLEIYIHQARDIHNICIYHNQDVYAKLCFAIDPENSVSTQIINGGGKNPVFNQTLQLNVPTVDTSLKCEIWMLSRVQNYLEDQLLGFVLIPLSDIIISNGKLEKEFSLSSTDLFHSPAGFVQLSLSYIGDSPEVMTIPLLPASLATSSAEAELESSESSPSKFDNLEFPDPKLVNENEMMVSEYCQIPCSDLDSEISESLVSPNTDSVPSSFSKPDVHSIQEPKCVSTDDSSSGSVPTSSLSTCDTPTMTSNSPNQEEHVSSLTKKISEPVIVVSNIEPDQNVVQQDIIDMYMKSMNQFTESLAKMKLPLDIAENGSTGSENSSEEKKLLTPKSANSRVFYGSRAFF